jgi:hypothetical protein
MSVLKAAMSVLKAAMSVLNAAMLVTIACAQAGVPPGILTTKEEEFCEVLRILKFKFGTVDLLI